MSNRLGLTICVCLFSLYLQQKVGSQCLPNPCNDGNCTIDNNNSVHCICGPKFNGSNCEIALKPPFHNCTDDPECVPNAICNGTKVCLCKDNYFDDYQKGTCENRVKVGERCLVNITTTNMCMKGAMCDINHLQCRCLPKYYLETNNTCSELRNVSQHCTTSDECVENAYCGSGSGNVCICFDDYYVHKDHCERKIAPGLGCVPAIQGMCVAGANCTDHGCVCWETTYYAFNNICHLRQHIDGQCDDAVPNMCLINGSCVGSRCQCNDNSFRYMDHMIRTVNDSCKPTLKVNTSCAITNHDAKQCESNSKCVFRYWDDTSVCGCDTEHFFNGHVCEPRALAGDPCPYNSRYHNNQRLEIDHQCVLNAKCSDLLTCECQPDFFQRGGHCPRRIRGGETCDPWADYQGQCVNGHQCLYGKCELELQPPVG